MTSTAAASRVSAGPRRPYAPVPSLTERISELLRVEKERDLVVDLYSRDLQFPRAIPGESRFDLVLGTKPIRGVK